MWKWHLLPVLVAAVICAAVFGCTREAPDKRAADEQIIRAAEIEAVRALNVGDIDGYMATYPEDSIWLPPNAPVVSGAEAIRGLAAQLAANPGFAFEVQPTTVEVSLAGDLAYLVGSYELTLNDPSGNSVTEHGKYVEVWKKHPDNTWNHVLAIWNSDEVPQN